MRKPIISLLSYNLVRFFTFPQFHFRFSTPLEGRSQSCAAALGVFLWVYGVFRKDNVIHGHRTLKAPHPVRSAQLTRVPPS
jgi:hypothetical protein